MAAPRHDRAEFAHVGGGTTLLLSYAALIPGVLPSLALLGVIAVVAVVPLIAVGLVLAIPLILVLAVRRLASRGRRAA
jgi:hypothetical protein